MSSLKRKTPGELRKALADLDTKDSLLLHLPQSDLTRSTRPNLVLMAMPPAKSKESDHVMQAIKDGKCSILTNEHSSSLVLPESSYTLTTIGTSNTFAVYRPTSDKSCSKDDDVATDTNNKGETSGNDNKKPKLDDRQACRLIHPGGSGASFLSLSKNQIKPEDVEALLKLKGKHTSSSSASSSSSSKQPCHTAHELCLALQCSVAEVELALESLPCSALPLSSTSTSSTDKTTTEQQQQEEEQQKYRLWTDEEYWNAKRALVEMLCEEVDAEDEDLAPEQFAELVAQRIVLPDDADDQFTTENAKNKWKLVMAKQMIRLGTTTTTTTTTIVAKKETRRRRYWDKPKISKWALQDLVLTSRQSTWALEELLSTWQSRLPLLWCNERIVRRRQEEESEESEPVDEMDDDANNASNNNNVATREALEAMAEVEIFIPESDGKKKATDTEEDKEMVELKF